jgi:hypothetical protein
MTQLSLSASDIAAVLALIAAMWSAVQTGRFNRRQNEFAATAERLNQLFIARETAESQEQGKADVSANFVKVGKHNHRLKVFNRGIGTARNVRLDVLAGEELIDCSALRDKFPVPALDRHQTIELLAAVHFGSPRRCHVRLLWDDDTGQARQKELWLDAF